MGGGVVLGGEYRGRGVGGRGWWCWEVSTGREEWVGGGWWCWEVSTGGEEWVGGGGGAGR